MSALEAKDAYDSVGPVLQIGELAEAVVEAICRENEAVVLHDRGSYIRVLVPRRCVLSRSAVESCLGREFQLPSDLELIMPAFKGRLKLDERGAVWSFEGEAKP